MSHAQRTNVKTDENAVAPVIGAVLIILLTIMLAGVTVATLYSSDAVQRLDNAFAETPRAVIEIEGIEGGLPNDVRYDENNIRLNHRNGDSLALDSTFLVISGNGSSYIGVVPTGWIVEYGDVVVKYVDLTPIGKAGKYYNKYTDRNPIIDDGLWSTGEQLILNGYDGDNTSADLSVFVTVNGLSNTANHYGFKAGSTVTVKIFDKRSGCIIAENTAIVQPVE